MKKRKGLLVFVTIFLMLTMMWPGMAMANAAEPPCFVILVNGAPEDLAISLAAKDSEPGAPIALQIKRQAWEAYYRYFYHDLPEKLDLSEAVLRVTGEGYDFMVKLPAETFQTYNNLLTLNLEEQTLTIGQPAWRVPLLVAMRMIATLLIEGVVFWLFRYRDKKSWILFIGINLLTQGMLNIGLTGNMPGEGYWMFALVFFEILVIIAESLLYYLTLCEHQMGRSVNLSVVANAASWALGAALLTYLPW